MLRKALTLLSSVAAVAFASGAKAQTDFYAGKTLTVYVGLAAGGSADTLVRGFTPYLKKHLPGQPNIVVQNMPGAGGVVAFNYIHGVAKPDGTSIVYSLWDPLAQALGNQGLKARYDQYEFLGGISDVRVNYFRTDAAPGKAKVPADIMKATELTVGAYASTDVAGILAHLSLEVLGLKHKVVTGYRGGADVFLALQRGEVNTHNTSLATFRTRSKQFVEAGDGMGLAYLVASDAKGAFQRKPEIKDMPAFQDLYQQIHGKLPSGPLWDALNWTTRQFGEVAYVGLAGPGTPEPAVSALRSGIKAAFEDKEFITETTKRFGLPYDYVGVEQGKAVFKELSNTPPAVLDTLRQTMTLMSGSK